LKDRNYKIEEQKGTKWTVLKICAIVEQ
jgi:hypothetical protein